MRGLARAGGLALALLVVAGAAEGRARRQVEVLVAPAGSLTYTWDGDPARGCAAEGLCGVHGSLTIRVGGSASGYGTASPPIELQDQDSVARSVQTAADGSTTSVCADSVPVDVILGVRSGSREARSAVVLPSSFELPSAGRCAGPTQSDLSRLVLPVRLIRGGGYELRGTESLAAGPFTVQVVSRIRVRFRHGFEGGGPPSVARPPQVRHVKVRHVLAESVELAYRVSAVRGQIGVTLAGVSPGCQPFGTCGSSGSITVSPGQTSGTLTFFGSRFVKHRRSAGGVLQDLRSGRLQVYDSGLPVPQRLSEALQEPGQPDCQDSVETSDGGFSFGPGSGKDHEVYRLLFDPGAMSFPPGTDDLLRTRCPGPLSNDVTGQGGLATGLLAVRSLGDQQLSVTASSGRSFAGGGYAGSTSGSLQFSLTRVRLKATVRRVAVGNGVPTG